MLKFFSFCCFINRHSHDDLIFGLKLLLSSLDYYVKDYEFILYTNFDINIDNKNLKIRNYYDNSYKNFYNDIWLNLSFNKINIYKDLHDETNEDYIWIDLDTIVTYDISYLENVDHFFIEYGGNCDNSCEVIINNFYLNVNRSIQGAIWKINLKLYNELMNLFNETQTNNLKIEYDIQGLVAYYLYHKLNGKIDDINIYGLNFYSNTLNGLGIWSCDPTRSKHSNIEGLNNMYYENNILKTKYFPDKEIHFAMFTFYTLNQVKNSVEFKKIFGHLLNF